MPTAAATPRRTPRSTGKLRQQFEKDGYYAPLKVFEPAEVTRFLASYNEYTAHNRARLDALKPNEKYQVLSDTHFILRWAYEITTHPRILDAVEAILGPDILAWNTNWFTKMPGEKTYISWHQDGTYWNLRPPTVVTAWVALTPSQPVNGCMRVIPGTHTKPALPQRETYKSDNALSRGQEIAVEVDENHAVDLALRPGEMSLHHIWIIHGSNANQSTTPRIGIAIRYTKPEVVQESPMKPFALLVRGEDRRGNFELLTAPTRNEAAATELDLHQKIVNRIRAGVMVDAQKKPAPAA